MFAEVCGTFDCGFVLMLCVNSTKLRELGFVGSLEIIFRISMVRVGVLEVGRLQIELLCFIVGMK